MLIMDFKNRNSCRYKILFTNLADYSRLLLATEAGVSECKLRKEPSGPGVGAGVTTADCDGGGLVAFANSELGSISVRV